MKAVVKMIEIVEECKLCWKGVAKKYRVTFGIQELRE